MIRPGQLFRLLYINWVLVRHGLDEIIFATHLFRPFRWIFYLAPWNWFRGQRTARAVRIRRALEDLGPIFVKFGQILSTRRDLLADELAEELAKLQDRVPPFPGTLAKSIVEAAYGKPVSELFLSFSEQPLASASIAQVHTAVLPDGKDVVVKVLRPDIEPTIRRDLALMYYVASLAERYWVEGRRLHPTEVISEFEAVIHDELDLIREAANAAQLRRNFEHSKLLYVPEVYWKYARVNVIVMERISGTPISDVEKLKAQNIDLKTLAEHGVEIFYSQVFSDNFFHADMHPGNIFVSPKGKYIAVDFGIMGTLSPDDQRYLAENFLAFFNRDYLRVAELHIESGWVPPDTRVDQFESAIRTVCEPNFNKPLKDISLGQVLLRLFQTARRFNMEVQPQLVLLQKTLLNVEGLGRQLYPDLDLWTTAKPFLERWMSEQLGSRAFFRRLKQNFPLWSEKLPEIPALLHDYLRQAKQSPQRDLQLQQEIERLRKLQAQHQQNLVVAIAGGSLLLSAAILAQFVDPSRSLFHGMNVLSLGMGSSGIAALLYAWLHR